MYICYMYMYVYMSVTGRRSIYDVCVYLKLSCVNACRPKVFAAGGRGGVFKTVRGEAEEAGQAAGGVPALGPGRGDLRQELD